MRHSIEYVRSRGILTSCPSTTPFSLALGPTNPGMITIAQETLDFRRAGISPALRLLIPTFSLPCSPRSVTLPLQRAWDALLPPSTSLAPQQLTTVLTKNTSETIISLKALTSTPLAYAQVRCWVRSFGTMLEPRYIVGAKTLD